MKISILIITLIVSVASWAQSWQNIGSPVGTNAVNHDLVIDKSTGGLYSAVIESATQRSTVRKWDGSAWQVQGNSNFGIGDTQESIELACINDQPYAAIRYTIGSTKYIRVYQLSGSTWVAMGDQAYQTNLYKYSLDVSPAGLVYLAFYKTGSTGLGVINQINVFQISATSQSLTATPSMGTNSYAPFDFSIDPANEFYLNYQSTFETIDDSEDPPLVLLSSFIMIEEEVGTPSALALDVWQTNSVNIFKTEAPANSDLRIGFSEGSLLTSMRYSASLNQVTTSAFVATGVSAFDMDSDLTNDYFFYCNSAGTTYGVKYSNTGGTASSLGTNFSTGSGAVSLPQMEVWSDRKVVSFRQGGQVRVMEINNPIQLSVGGSISVCEATLKTMPGYITATDNNYAQNVVVNLNSTNTSVIPNTALSLVWNGSSYDLVIQPLSVSADQVVTIDVTAYDNGSLSDADAFTTSVINNPDVTVSLTDLDYCSNNAQFDLNPYTNPLNGEWTGDGITGLHYFSPQLAGPGSHTITYAVTNAGGCTVSQQLPMVVFQTPQIDFAVTVSACGETNGEIDATISGGLPPYNLYWSNGQVIEDIYALSPDIYTLFVSDQHGCENTKTTSTVSAGFDLVADITNVQCYGGTDGAINLLLDPGDMLYIESILWSNGATTEDISGLTAGTYEVYVTGTNGCTSTESFVVGSPAQLTAAMYTNNASCGNVDGDLSCVVSGGSPAYIYEWTDVFTGASVGSGLSYLSDIPSGFYQVQITDDAGCTLLKNAVVSEDGAPQIIVDSLVETGCVPTGEIYISVNSGVAIGSILWSNGATTEDVTGLDGGYYGVEVTDNNGCKGWASAFIEQGAPIPVDICLVTVDTATNTNLIVWEKPVSADIASFNIYRETATAGEYLLVGNVPYADESVYNDLVASPSIRSWRYKISTVNQCGVESEISDFHKTIHLTISQGIGGVINLSWDEYTGFDFAGYDVYRHSASEGWVLIQTMPTNLFSYADSPTDTEELYYIVSVNSPTTCTSSLYKVQDHNSSRSNKTASAISGGSSGLDEAEIEVTVSPNPSAGRFEIVLSQPATYVVVDVFGQVVQSGNFSDQVNELDLTEHANGVYLLQVNTPGKTQNIRLVKV